MNRMKRFLILLAAFVSFSATAQQKVFKLSGKAPGKDGQRVFFFRYTEQSSNTLGADTVRNGKFNISCVVDEVTPALLQIGEVYGGTIILEPAAVQYELTGNGSFRLTGGKYNAILNGFLRNKEYRAADNKFKKITNGGDIAFVKGTPQEWDALQLFLRKEDARTNYLAALVEQHPDPLVKGIAAIMSELQPDAAKTMGIIEPLASKIGESSIVMRRLRAIDKQQRETVARRHSKMLGEQYTDFIAQDLDGTTVRLSAIVKANKYTLLQFWASWCGPCRKEIPALKEMYAHYGSKGMGLVSFSMDDSKSNWEKASAIEKIPWPNISDLKAFNSPIAKQYPIMGIPANVIIDANGKIVASNLTGKDLEDKIQSLFQ